MKTRDQLLPRCELALAFADRQVRRLVEIHPGLYPEYTVGGVWSPNKNPWTSWCEGFTPGQMWLLHRYTGDSWWRTQAEAYSRSLEPRKTDRQVHDLGFLFWTTYKPWYDLSGDESLKDVLVQAGRTMALRFNPKGKYLRSFLAADSLFIDIMMNVGIVFYAAQVTGDEELWEIATQHCLTTRKYLVRGDGSTAHEGVFDLESGAFLRQSTQQGWRPDSCWARGTAWALYGFGTAYRFTRDECTLATAQLIADYYMRHTPEHGVPPNDWDEPNPQYPYESSAAAIAASGLLNLAELLVEPQQAEKYRRYAYCILDTLTSPQFLATQDPGYEGVLKHAIYHLDKGLGVDESVAWGDYFFLEALLKVLHG